MSAREPNNAVVRQIWDANADFWNDQMGEGNLFHRYLVGPAAERLVQIRPGERVIEFGCGNGQFSRRLAELGAMVLATDLSPRLIDHARERTAQRQDLAAAITFETLDAADETALAAIPGGPYDAAVCNMVIMDMIEVEPLFTALSRLLRPGGRFVFTLMHPCFNNVAGSNLVQEDVEIDGDYRQTFSVRVHRYRSTGAQRGTAMMGQPEPHWYFHRTLSELLGTAFQAGLVMDGIEEPYFPSEIIDQGGSLSWMRFSEIPPVLGVRLRVPEAQERA